MRLLLDTNAYTAWKRGHRGVVELVREAEHLYLSAIVAGELLYGFRNGSRYDRNLRELNRFLERPQVSFVPVTLTTADRFGRVATDLRRLGRPIPLDDVWIAAHAFETGAELITFDRHFERVPGLAATVLDG